MVSNCGRLSTWRHVAFFLKTWFEEYFRKKKCFLSYFSSPPKTSPHKKFIIPSINFSTKNPSATTENLVAPPPAPRQRKLKFIFPSKNIFTENPSATTGNLVAPPLARRQRRLIFSKTPCGIENTIYCFLSYFEN